MGEQDPEGAEHRDHRAFHLPLLGLPRLERLPAWAAPELEVREVQMKIFVSTVGDDVDFDDLSHIIHEDACVAWDRDGVSPLIQPHPHGTHHKAIRIYQDRGHDNQWSLYSGISDNHVATFIADERGARWELV